MSLRDGFVLGFMALGTFFFVVAAIGLLRLPDLLMRMQAATKAATLGLMCILLGVVIHFRDLLVTVEASLVVLFIFLTTPIASHLIARAAYVAGVTLWERTAEDEMRVAMQEPSGSGHEPQVQAEIEGQLDAARNAAVENP